MKTILSVGSVLLLVPLQMTMANIVGGRLWPDFCLVAACLAGFWGGWGRGLTLGLSVGFLQDLFSAGGLGVNLLLKGFAGLLSGYAATTLSTITPGAILFPAFALSMFVNLIALLSASPQVDWRLLLHSTHAVIVPQGLMDGVLALALNWMIHKVKSPEAIAGLSKLQ